MLKPPLGSQLQLGHPLSQGLVGCWLMNEGSGNRVNDLSGNGNTGTLAAAAPTWTPGRFGSCLAFGDGTSAENVNCGNSPVLSPARRTVSAWIYLESATNWRCLFGGAAKIYISNQKIVTWPFSFTGTTVIPLNKWSMVTITDDQTTFSAYVNGVLDSSVGGGAFSTGSITTLIGSDYSDPANGQTFIGSIDDAMIYNRALTAGEVAELYRDPFCMFREEPIELWTAATSGEAVVSVTVTPSVLASVLNLTGPTTAYDFKHLASALQAVLSLQTPTETYDFTATPSTLGATLSLQAPTLTYDFTVTPDALASILALQTPTYSYGCTVIPDALASTLSLNTPTITYDFTVLPSALGSVLSLQSPSVTYDFTVLPSAFAALLNLQDPTIVTGVSVTVSPAALAAALSLKSPSELFDFTHVADAQGLELSLNAPTPAYDYSMALGSVLSLACALPASTVALGMIVIPDAASLILSLQTPTLTYDYLMSLGDSLGMACTIKAPTIDVPEGRTYIVCSSTDPAVLDIYVGGTLVARFT